MPEVPDLALSTLSIASILNLRLLQIFTLQVGVVEWCHYDPTLLSQLSHIFNMTRRDF